MSTLNQHNQTSSGRLWEYSNLVQNILSRNFFKHYQIRNHSIFFFFIFHSNFVYMIIDKTNEEIILH
jgi:hypothetical protein